MTDQRVLIADPNRGRRLLLRDICAEYGVADAVCADSLSETYRLAELHRPRRVAVAASLAGTGDYAALLEMMRLISADCLVYGEGTRSGTNQVHMLDGPEGARRFVATLLAGLVPDRGMPAAPVAAPERGPRGRGPQAALLLIGASTGGVGALETILAGFPTDCPPTLIVQHMRPGFGEGLIQRLDRLVRPRVVAAEDGVPLRPGVVHMAAGNGCHLGVVRRSGLATRLIPGAAVGGHCPSVDVLFDHGAALAGNVAVRAALLTGMGADGAAGLGRLRAAGAHTIAQDRDSSVVWGMPRVAVEMNAAVEILPLGGIAAALLRQDNMQGA